MPLVTYGNRQTAVQPVTIGERRPMADIGIHALIDPLGLKSVAMRLHRLEVSDRPVTTIGRTLALYRDSGGKPRTC